MWSLLLIGLGLGLVDCLNPFTISTQVVLQPFVKKPHHTLYYIAGTYIMYFFGGVLVFYGVDKLIGAFWDTLMASYSVVIFSVEILLGIALLAMSIIFLYRRIKKKRTLDSMDSDTKQASVPKSVKPAFLIFFGAANTIGDLPTAFPYLMFIAKLVEAKQSFWSVLVLLAFYCIVYIMPLIIVFLLYLFSKKKLENLLEKLRGKFASISQWAAIIVPAVAGGFFGIHGFINVLS